MKKTALLKNTLLITVLSAALISCDKSDDDNVDVATLKQDILNDASTTVITASYEDMYTKATALSTAVDNLIATTSDANLTTARNAWKDIRTTWEQTESWLFGPVSSDDIDPRIDTWPVDFNALNAQLASSNTFNEAYIDGLDDDLKGFHPIEYLLWGQNGNKTAASFTTREKEYLSGLSVNLKKLTQQVRDSWTTGGYANILKTAGQAGNSTYPTLQSAYVEMADAMAGICDEVANGKMLDPFTTQDPSQEESPFAKNSITDFTNNIQGILKIYQGKFTADGKGIEDLVRHYNLSLDNEIKTKHATAIAALQAITVPFGQAISTQQSQVQSAMDKINDLASTLENSLKPFLIQYVQ
ncbi:MAG: imelysin family protein [Ferruginibacter sp.]